MEYVDFGQKSCSILTILYNTLLFLENVNQKRFGPAQKFWTGPKLFWTFISSGEAVKFIEKNPTFRLIECSHVSGKQWAINFFGLASSFPNLLNIIDELDGIRKIFNQVSTLSILVNDVNLILSDDEEYAQRQSIR